jgi:hypothetical protein
MTEELRFNALRFNYGSAPKFTYGSDTVFAKGSNPALIYNTADATDPIRCAVDGEPIDATHPYEIECGGTDHRCHRHLIYQPPNAVADNLSTNIAYHKDRLGTTWKAIAAQMTAVGAPITGKELKKISTLDRPVSVAELAALARVFNEPDPWKLTKP